MASSLVASGMLTVKVDEWCLVCYVWLAAALATTSMLSDLSVVRQVLYRLERIVGFLC